MTEEEFYDIEYEAHLRMRKNQRGTRGQVVRLEDGIDWWIAQVAYERGREEGAHD